MPPASESRYRLPKFENWINRFIGFIFYYRLIFVLITVGFIYFLCVRVWDASTPDEKLKNAALVFTGGSIIIGIFYSIINYEHNLSKFKYDVKAARETLTFTTAAKMYEADMVKYFRTVKAFYETYINLFKENKGEEINKLLIADPDTRVAFVIIFNYFEGISISINQCIMDEDFMKEFFKTIFKNYYNRYGMFLDYLRKDAGTKRIFRHFTALAERWDKED
jgi:hypothetical protein